MGEVSGVTQAVLAIGAGSAAIAALWVASLLARLILSLARPSAAASKRPAASKAHAKGTAKAADKNGTSDAPAAAGGRRGPDLKTLIKESQSAKRSAHTKEDMAAHHALFLTTLKGHGDVINGVAWSPDGKLLASACDDLQLRVFDMHDVTSKDPKFRFQRLNQPALAVGFGNGPNEVVAVVREIPDNASLVLFAPSKAKSSSGAFQQQWETPKALDKEPLLEAFVVPASTTGAGVAVLLSRKKFGRVFRLADGKPLSTFEPNSLGNHALAVSAGGRFFAVASFTADVKVWEVEWGRDGYKGVPRAMDLKGHSRKVMSAAINPEGTRAATASEDGSIRIWKLDVRYQLQEDPKTLQVIPLTDLGLKEGQVFERMAWGPDGTIAAVHGLYIHLFDAASGKLLERLHAHEAPITCVSWAPAPAALGGERRAAVFASSSGDRRVRVWRSPKELDE